VKFSKWWGETPSSLRFPSQFNLKGGSSESRPTLLGSCCNALCFVALLVLVAGCATVEHGKQPQVRLSDGKLAQISFAGADLKFDLVVRNPTERELKLDAYHWEFFVSERRLAQGHSRAIQRIEPQSDLAVPIEVALLNGDVFTALGTDRPASPPGYELKLSAMVTGGMLNLRRDFRKTGTLPILHKLNITLQNFRVIKETDTAATVRFDALLENQNAFAVNLDTITASLNLAGRPVAQEFKTSPKSIPASGRTVADFELELDLALLGPTVVNALKQRDVRYEFSGTTCFETPWGRKTLNFFHSGQLRIER